MSRTTNSSQVRDTDAELLAMRQMAADLQKESQKKESQKKVQIPVSIHDATVSAQQRLTEKDLLTVNQNKQRLIESEREFREMQLIAKQIATGKVDLGKMKGFYDDNWSTNTIVKTGECDDSQPTHPPLLQERTDVADQKAADEKAAELQATADKEAADQKAAAAELKAVADQKAAAAELQATADKEAADQKAAAAELKAVADQKAAAAELQATADKAADDKAAAKKAIDDQKAADQEATKAAELKAVDDQKAAKATADQEAADQEAAVQKAAVQKAAELKAVDDQKAAKATADQEAADQEAAVQTLPFAIGSGTPKRSKATVKVTAPTISDQQAKTISQLHIDMSLAKTELYRSGQALYRADQAKALALDAHLKAMKLQTQQNDTLVSEIAALKAHNAALQAKLDTHPVEVDPNIQLEQLKAATDKISELEQKIEARRLENGSVVAVDKHEVVQPPADETVELEAEIDRLTRALRGYVQDKPLFAGKCVIGHVIDRQPSEEMIPEIVGLVAAIVTNVTETQPASDEPVHVAETRVGNLTSYLEWITTIKQTLTEQAECIHDEVQKAERELYNAEARAQALLDEALLRQQEMSRHLSEVSMRALYAEVPAAILELMPDVYKNSPPYFYAVLRKFVHDYLAYFKVCPLMETIDLGRVISVCLSIINKTAEPKADANKADEQKVDEQKVDEQKVDEQTAAEAAYQTDVSWLMKILHTYQCAKVMGDTGEMALMLSSEHPSNSILHFFILTQQAMSASNSTLAELEEMKKKWAGVLELEEHRLKTALETDDYTEADGVTQALVDTRNSFDKAKQQLADMPNPMPELCSLQEFVNKAMKGTQIESDKKKTSFGCLALRLLELTASLENVSLQDSLGNKVSISLNTMMWVPDSDAYVPVCTEVLNSSEIVYVMLSPMLGMFCDEFWGNLPTVATLLKWFERYTHYPNLLEFKRMPICQPPGEDPGKIQPVEVRWTSAVVLLPKIQQEDSSSSASSSSTPSSSDDEEDDEEDDDEKPAEKPAAGEEAAEEVSAENYHNFDPKAYFDAVIMQSTKGTAPKKNKLDSYTPSQLQELKDLFVQTFRQMTATAKDQITVSLGKSKVTNLPLYDFTNLPLFEGDVYAALGYDRKGLLCSYRQHLINPTRYVFDLIKQGRFTRFWRLFIQEKAVYDANPKK